MTSYEVKDEIRYLCQLKHGRKEEDTIRVTTGWENYSGLTEVAREEYLEHTVQEKEMKWPFEKPCIIEEKKAIIYQKDKL